MSESRLQSIIKTISMHDKLRDMHRNIQESTGRRRNNAVEAHNRHTNVRPANFSLGDFVLKGETKSGPKLRRKWTGPYLVTQCQSKFLFTVKDLIDGKTYTAHGRRLKLFGNSDYEVTEDILCLLYTSPSPRDQRGSRMPSSA